MNEEVFMMSQRELSAKRRLKSVISHLPHLLAKRKGEQSMIVKHLVEQTTSRIENYSRPEKLQLHVLVYDCETIIHKKHVLFIAARGRGLVRKRFCISPFVGIIQS